MLRSRHRYTQPSRIYGAAFTGTEGGGRLVVETFTPAMPDPNGAKSRTAASSTRR
jgi:hypothetical protein